MNATIKVQSRNDRLYKYITTYICAVDIKDFGYHGAAVKATGLFSDEIKEIKTIQGKAVYTKVPSGYIQRFADITSAN